MTTPDSLLDPQKISRLGNLEFIARIVVEGFLRGIHRSHYKGSSVEFSENRPYSPGDEIARLDWRAFAKTDKLFLKEYEDETNLRLTFLMDTSASMAFGTTGISKYRYATCLAASLGQLMLQQLDAIGLVMFDKDLRSMIPPRVSQGQFKGILDQLDKTIPQNKTNFKVMLKKASEAIKPRSLVILLSDLLDNPGDILHGLAKFRMAKTEVVVFHVVDPAELNFPFTNWTIFRDAESPDVKIKMDGRWIRDEYLENLKNHIHQIRKGCLTSSIDYQLVDIRTPFDIVLSRYLTARRKHGAR